MRRFFSHPITALTAGFCLRLFFVLKFPAGSGDTILYEEFASNWLRHGCYCMNVAGVLTPIDMRVPGYPAFLAFLYALSGRTGADAHLWVMLAQVFVDLATCVLIAWLAHVLLQRRERVFTAALWLAATCPFVANYVAVPLTETLAIFLTALAFLALALIAEILQNRTRSGMHTQGLSAPHGSRKPLLGFSVIAGIAAGFAALLRPESPLLLMAAWLVIAVYCLLCRDGRWLRIVVVSGIACGLPLVPWTIRNAITLHEFQPLAPEYSNLPGEIVPYGFMRWEKTWLWRFRDVYLVPWKLNGEAIRIEDVPSNAFDSESERERVADLLDQYNETLSLTHEEDDGFGQLGHERTARNPLRTYVELPAMRALVMWFTPRIELLPFSGHVFPLRASWEDDPIDQSVTIGLFFLNIFYVVLAMWGTLRLWRAQPTSRLAIAVCLAYVVLRTAFLTTLETPEPRYVLECYPLLLALGAQVFLRRQVE
jgi:hypothetical protein